MSPHIRPARPEDAPALARVIVDTYLAAHRGQIPEAQWQKRRTEWTYADSERSWRELLTRIEAGDSHEECVYVAVADDGVTDDGEVVGLALARPSDLTLLENAAEIGPLYVRQGYQGQGLGRLLVQATAAHQANLGRRNFVIRVLHTNAPARRFYEALGGRVLGTHTGEDDGFEEIMIVYGWEAVDG